MNYFIYMLGNGIAYKLSGFQNSKKNTFIRSILIWEIKYKGKILIFVLVF